jgi:3-hydroxybutyrate dehydrogenase
LPQASSPEQQRVAFLVLMLGPAAVKRFLEVDEVAALLRFLCSNAAGGITGSAQMIDGGWTAR